MIQPSFAVRVQTHQDRMYSLNLAEPDLRGTTIRATRMTEYPTAPAGGIVRTPLIGVQLSKVGSSSSSAFFGSNDPTISQSSEWS